MSLDLFNIHIREIGAKAASNKVAEILTVIKDGDGNNNAATQYKAKTFDSGVIYGIDENGMD